MLERMKSYNGQHSTTLLLVGGVGRSPEVSGNANVLLLPAEVQAPRVPLEGRQSTVECGGIVREISRDGRRNN